MDERSTVIDLAAGPGVFATAVAGRCGRVIAVDVSPAMTSVLRALVEQFGLDNVEVVEGGFLSYEAEPGSADIVFTRNTLHQLPDFWKSMALRRLHTALKPGGILRLSDLVFDFEPSQAEARVSAWFAGAVTDPTLGFTAAELATHLRSEFSTFTWLLEPMLERTGFEIIEHTHRRSAYATCTRRRLDSPTDE